MTILHSALYDANSHKPGYIQSGDPGAVGAGIVWVDTSGGTGAWVLKVRNGTDTGWETISGGGGGGYDYLLYRHTASQNTAGGTATSGSDQTMPITEETVDTAGIGSLNSNQITLPAGTYRYNLMHVFYRASGAVALVAQIWLYNVSDTANVADSESTSMNYYYNNAVTISQGRVTIADTKTFEVRYRVSATQSTTGLGSPANFREEVYGIFEFWKE